MVAAAASKGSETLLLGYLSYKDTTFKLPRQTRVKNKTPASIQITADQILRQVQEIQQLEESLFRPPKHQIIDSTKLIIYSERKRKHFEVLISRHGRNNPSVFVNYALWKESQTQFNHVRSVWERAIDAHRRDHTLYLKYAKMEIKNKFINRARNVFDRAVTLFPRVDQLWYKYIHMEEMLGNVAGARQIFERWMQWAPDQQGWLSYIRFELRYKVIERARLIFDKFVQCHCKASVWIKYCKFEVKNGETARARTCFERGIKKMIDNGEEAKELLVAFAEFEEQSKAIDRARW